MPVAGRMEEEAGYSSHEQRREVLVSRNFETAEALAVLHSLGEEAESRADRATALEEQGGMAGELLVVLGYNCSHSPAEEEGDPNGLEAALL